MPQHPRPWFRASTGWWMAQVDRKQVKLHPGPDDPGTRKLAQVRLNELLRLREMTADPDSGNLTVAAVIDLYLQHAQTRYAARSLYERRLTLQAFAEAHGWRKVNDKDCLPFHLTSWLDKHPEWKSDWTLAQVVATVQRPFNWAARQRLIAANPFRGVTHRPGEPRRPLTDDEFARLLASARGRETKSKPTPGERFVELLRFLRMTGARPGEASRLKWADLDLDGAVIILTRHKTSRTQRTPKPRVIPLHPDIVALLLAIRLRAEPGEYVFRTHRGSPWNRCSLSLRMQRARLKAGLPADTKLYGLRHAFGTRSILNGVDLKTLAELMGHTTTRMSEHYVHLAGQKAHLAAAMLRANAPTPSA